MSQIFFFSSNLHESLSYYYCMNHENFYCESVEQLVAGLGDLGTPGDFTVLHWNVQRVSRLSKFERLVDYVKDLPLTPDIIALCETWFTTGETNEGTSAKRGFSLYQIEGYVGEFSSRESRSAGIAIYLKQGTRYEVLEKSNGPVSFLHLKILGKGNTDSLFLTAIYMPSLSDHPILMETLEKLFLGVGTAKHLIIGDFNIDTLKNLATQLTYSNLLESHGYTISNAYQTRPASGSLIDHITTNFDPLVNFTVENDLSDHNYILSFLQMKLPSAKRVRVEHSKTDYERLNNLLTPIFDLECLYADKEPEEIVKFLINTIDANLQTCTKTVGYTAKRETRFKPGVDRIVIRLSNAKRKLLSKLKRRPTDLSLKQKIKQMTTLINDRKDSMRREYFSKRFSMSTDTKRKWKELNSMLGRKKAANVIQRLVSRSGDVLDDNQEIVQELNGYFSTIGKELCDSVPEPSAQPDMNTSSPSGSMVLFEVSRQEVLQELQNLDVNKASGLDKLSNRVLKNCALPVSLVLTHCVNKIFTGSNYPHSLKMASVRPIFKGGDKKALNNYRPISILPSLNKVVERILNRRIMNFLSHTRLLAKSQYGFRSHSKTSTAALEMLDFVYGNLDQRKTRVVSALGLDLTKAFDSVDHVLLLRECEKAGLRGPVLDLLKSYLSERVQVVSNDGCTSGFEKVQTGVPQGSVLGPTLFLIFVNCLESLKLRGRLFLFADDTCLFYAGADDTQNCQAMNEDLIQLGRFFSSKLLTLNKLKTKYIHLRSHSTRLEHGVPVVFDGVTIEQTDCFEFLGLKIDSHLTWQTQCETLSKRIRPIIGIMYKLREFLPKEALMNVYYAFVHSQLSYMVEIWGQAASTHLKPLQILQNRALKLALGLDRLTRTSELFTVHAPNVLPVKGLHLLNVCKFVKQAMNNEIYYTLNFLRNETSLSVRNPRIFCLQQVNTNYGQKRILNYGPALYHSLPIELRSQRRTPTFLKKAKLHFKSPPVLDSLL